MIQIDRYNLNKYSHDTFIFSMKLRKKFWPRTVADFAATFFLLINIPIHFWFELWVVFPEVHGSGSALHIIFCLLGLFIVFNIVSNLMGVILCDTSTRDLIISPPRNCETVGWRLCATCEAVAPPRSWHCPVCDVCILKRDHHCVFSGCCIGFRNHRYYMMLLFHMAVATTVCVLYNSYFIWFVHATDFKGWISYVKVVFPLAMLVYDTNIQQYYFVIYLIGIIGAMLTSTLFIYHLDLIKKGTIVHEKTHKVPFTYDIGAKENIKLVLGSQYHLVWISPFIQSPLTHDGVHWETIAQESSKLL